MNNRPIHAAVASLRSLAVLCFLSVLPLAASAVVVGHAPVVHSASGAVKGKVLYVWEGASDRPMDVHSIRARNGYISTLVGAQYDVVEVALTRTANSATTSGIQNVGSQDLISGVLDSTFDQVWIVNNFASITPANLSANDIGALRSWSDSTGRDDFVMDAMGWRFHENNVDETNLTTNIVNTLNGAGGGFYLAADNEQQGGSLVATVNQVMDEFGFARWSGAHNVPPSGITFGGSLFDSPTNPVDPTNVAGSVLGSVAALPNGVQNHAGGNGRTLYTAMSGEGHPTSNPLQLNINHVLTTTIAAASATPVPAPPTLFIALGGLLLVLARKRA